MDGPSHFWQELDELLAGTESTELATDEVDRTVESYVLLCGQCLDDYLSNELDLDAALVQLLTSPLFTTAHEDRAIAAVLAFIVSPTARTNTQALFFALMLVLHLGLSDPTQASRDIIHAQSNSATSLATGGTAKVFRLLRSAEWWNLVVAVLVDNVANHSAIVHGDTIPADTMDSPRPDCEDAATMPANGWEERVGAAATGVLYEVCRAQKLSWDELSMFSTPFINRLFDLVELTRDASDETFNYSLIKLLIALNEQFMVSSLSVSASTGPKGLQAPLQPKGKERENRVLEVMKLRMDESKTFGENVIFILNRSNGAHPDSLCVSLLILKILYLLFTTSTTSEYFYTNDLCVLVDVFLRELCDLGPESEGLKHTYLRVLHPLLTNTQLRTFPYKRALLRSVLQSLLPSTTGYRASVSADDATTHRLVERCLRGEWCVALTGDEGSPRQGQYENEDDRRRRRRDERQASLSVESAVGAGGRLRSKSDAGAARPGVASMPSTLGGLGKEKDMFRHQERRGSEAPSVMGKRMYLQPAAAVESSASVNAVATSVAEDAEDGQQTHSKPRRRKVEPPPQGQSRTRMLLGHGRPGSYEKKAKAEEDAHSNGHHHHHAHHGHDSQASSYSSSPLGHSIMLEAPTPPNFHGSTSHLPPQRAASVPPPEDNGSDYGSAQGSPLSSSVASLTQTPGSKRRKAPPPPRSSTASSAASSLAEITQTTSREELFPRIKRLVRPTPQEIAGGGGVSTRGIAELGDRLKSEDFFGAADGGGQRRRRAPAPPVVR